MKVLLITTLPNKVKEALDAMSGIELCILDILSIKDKESTIKRTIHQQQPDVLITYRCPYVLSIEIIAAIPQGAYNIHPSMLPQYKGLNPWQEIFENHETKNGVTLHRITEDIDGGPIIMQKAYDISPNDTIMSAREKSDKLASELVQTACIFFLQAHHL